MKDNAYIGLIDNYKKEIWKWKQKESQWIMDKNQLEGNRRIIEELTTKMVELQTKIKKLESNRPLNTMDEVAYRELQVETKQLKSTLTSAQEINKSHQRYNGKLSVRLAEVEEDNKKLAKQIEDINKRGVVL